MLVLQSTNSGMGAGVSSAIARAVGAGNVERADALVFHAFLLALALGAIFAGLMLLGGPTLFRLMGGQDDMLDAALAYAYVALGGAAAICMLNFMGNAVRGTGNMALPAGVLVACVLAHIAISPILIFGFGPLPALGAAGAAWGLVLPFAAGGAWFVWYLHSGRALVRLTFRGATVRWELFADILKVGVPGLVNTAFTNLSVVVLTAISARMGRDIAIGYAMGARLEYIMQPLAFGFGTAILAMVGTNWGARQYARARAIALTGVTTVAAVCGSIGITVAIFPALWLGLFSDDPDVLPRRRPLPARRRAALPLLRHGPRIVLRLAGSRPRRRGGRRQRGAPRRERRLRAHRGLLARSRHDRVLRLGRAGLRGLCGAARLGGGAGERARHRGRGNRLSKHSTEKEHPMESRATLLLTGIVVLFAATPSIGAPLCKPTLTVTAVRFSGMAPAHRLWTAELAADTSRCAAASGPFAINFVRLKEDAPDMRFTEQFTWKPGRFEVSADFAADEAVLDYAIEVGSCPCRE